MHRSFLVARAALALSISFAPSLRAQCSILKRAPQPNPGILSFFGNSLAVDGDRALVCAHLVQTEADSTGVVYAYRRDGPTWLQTQRFFSSYGQSGSGFGLNVALDEKRAVVSAFFDSLVSDGAGVAYIFDEVDGAWTETARLVASDASDDMYFGEGLALQGDRLVVGASGDDASANPGAVYVFQRVAGVWNEVQKLVPSDSAGGDEFGNKVELAGDRIVVGAPFALVGGSRKGAAYVFDRLHSSWTQTAKIVGSGVVTNGRFGLRLALSENGKRALIGAPDELADRGAAYVFEEVSGTWVERVKLVQPGGGATGDAFGLGTALRGDLAVVGAVGVDQNMINPDRGSAFVFRRLATGEWLSTQTVLPTTIARQEFGEDISISGDTLLVGARRDLNYRGSAYFVEIGGDVANYCIAAPNSTGQGCTIGWSGSTSHKSNTFELTASNAPPTVVGTFAYSTLAAQTPFGNGYQCLGGSSYTLLPAVITDASGSAEFKIDFGAHTALQPGTTWLFQFTYDDPAAGGAGFNLSNGLCATFCP